MKKKEKRKVEPLVPYIQIGYKKKDRVVCKKDYTLSEFITYMTNGCTDYVFGTGAEKAYSFKDRLFNWKNTYISIVITAQHFVRCAFDKNIFDALQKIFYEKTQKNKTR